MAKQITRYNITLTPAERKNNLLLANIWQFGTKVEEGYIFSPKFGTNIYTVLFKFEGSFWAIGLCPHYSPNSGTRGGYIFLFMGNSEEDFYNQATSDNPVEDQFLCGSYSYKQLGLA